jgi:hypothetical protein
MLFIDRANEYFSTAYRMPTQERKTDVLLFPGVYEYAAPSDLGAAIPLRKPISGASAPDFDHVTVRGLARRAYGRQMAVAYDGGTQYLVFRESDGASSVLNACSSLTEDGTWAVSGDGSGLATDESIVSDGPTSLRFDVTGSGGTTTLTCSGMEAKDVSAYEKGYAFIDLYVPRTNVTTLASVTLDIGSDASNYLSVTATTRHRGDAILGGWGKIGFDLTTRTDTGTPDLEAVTYIRMTLDHGTSGTDGTYRVDSVFLALPTYYELPYYSTKNIEDATGARKQKVTATSDTVLCPDEFRSAYAYKAMQLAAVEALQDAGLANYFSGELSPKEATLRARFPVQERRSSTSWYPKARNF